jgi:hypothetical protein
VEKFTPDITRDISDKKASKVWSLGDIRLFECPLSWITPETNLMISQVYLVAESPALLLAGGWMDQPNWFIEAWDIYQLEKSDHIKEPDTNG